MVKGEDISHRTQIIMEGKPLEVFLMKFITIYRQF
jgi:hypothetical protein